MDVKYAWASIVLLSEVSLSDNADHMSSASDTKPSGLGDWAPYFGFDCIHHCVVWVMDSEEQDNAE
jgi:hypothetical protein